MGPCQPQTALEEQLPADMRQGWSQAMGLTQQQQQQQQQQVAKPKRKRKQRRQKAGGHS
jgi:hypothetical protein